MAPGQGKFCVAWMADNLIQRKWSTLAFVAFIACTGIKKSHFKGQFEINATKPLTVLWYKIHIYNLHHSAFKLSAFQESYPNIFFFSVLSIQ